MRSNFTKFYALSVVLSLVVSISHGAYAQDASMTSADDASTFPTSEITADAEVTTDAATIPAAATNTVPPVPVTATPPAAPVAEHAPAWYERLKFEGLVDTYFMANLSNHPGDAPSLRVFDTQAMSFNLAYAGATMQLPADPVGFRIGLGFGPVASLTTPPGTPYRDVLVPIQQAYVSLRLPGVSWLTIDAGKFPTTAGFEVIAANGNWNYSRSLLFGYAIPFAHTGIRATAVANEHFTAQASVVNGWDDVIDNNSGKTFGIAGSYDSGHGTTASVTAYGGPEQPNNDHDWRFLVDAIVGQAVGEHWNFALNGDFAYEMPGITWWGVAGYARFVACDHLRIAARAEYFSDTQGTRLGITMPSMVPGGNPTAVPAGVFEGTATIAVPMFDHAELRGEYRIDAATVGAFAGRSHTQQTATIAALAWF